MALMAVLACVALGGLVFAGVYLLAGDDSDSTEAFPSAEVSGAGLEGEGGDSTEAGEPTGGGLSPSERGFPTDSKPTIRSEAEGLLREFHTAIVEGDYRYAWSLMTARKRAKEEQEQSFAGWREAQASLTPYLLPEGIRVEIDGLEEGGVARVTVTGMGWTLPGSPCSEWSGLTWVRYEEGLWRYDPGYSTTAERRRRWQDRSDELLGVGC